MSAEKYWEQRYFEAFSAHSDQNKTITKDFIHLMPDSFRSAIMNSKKILEVGCGTGEMCQMLSEANPHASFFGIDISANAINVANKKYSNDKIKYKAVNLLFEDVEGRFDLSICSNTLEHFKNPYPLIDRMLKFSTAALILVPYNQRKFDGYDSEGGAGHVFRFDDSSFNNYTILDKFTFFTNGWTWSSDGEDPLQLAVLIK